MKDTFYFSHDYNTRFDEKIKRLLMKHGMLGYGCYWSIIEDLYNNANEMRLDCERIAFELRVNCDVINSILNDFDLFQIDTDTISSKSVQRRLDERNEKSTSARKSAIKRWEKYERNANALRTQSEGYAIKERKGKEIKDKSLFLNQSESLFDSFWELYSKKIGRKDCKAKFMKLSIEDMQKIVEAVPRYVASTPEEKYRKHPETYLNGRHWEDEIKTPQVTQQKQIGFQYPELPSKPVDFTSIYEEK
jgi:hypothetical protein